MHAERQQQGEPVTAHDPDVLCDCMPGGEGRFPACEYRALADSVDAALNPPETDAAEVAIHIAAVERVAAYVKSLPCACTTAAADYDDDPCGRCRAVGQRCGKAEPR